MKAERVAWCGIAAASGIIAALSALPYAGGWNDGSRLATVESLVDHHIAWVVLRTLGSSPSASALCARGGLIQARRFAAVGRIRNALGWPLAQAAETAAGIWALLRYGFRAERVETAISLFRSDSLTVAPGRRETYRVVLAHAPLDPAWVVLVIDIYFRDRPTHPEGHYAYFRKDLWLAARAALSVDVIYDWEEGASFTIDGVVVPPDEFWRGPCREAGDYLVSAVLYSDKRTLIEQLKLRQRLES